MAKKRVGNGGFDDFDDDNSGNRDNSVKTGTPRQRSYNRDSPGQTGTVGMFVYVRSRRANGHVPSQTFS